MDRAEPITIIIKTDNRVLTNIFPRPDLCLLSSLNNNNKIKKKTKIFIFLYSFLPHPPFDFHPSSRLDVENVSITLCVLGI